MHTPANPPLGFLVSRHLKTVGMPYSEESRLYTLDATLVASHAAQLGRSAFFGSSTRDLPHNRAAEVAANDAIPQFGFVGDQYMQRQVLLLGINPGNGPDNEVTLGDQLMVPAWKEFYKSPIPSNFAKAQNAYRGVCERWPVWGRHCAVLLSAVGLSLDEIAYTNCLPWRTASKSNFDDDVAQKAGELYVVPLLKELSPRIIVAVGKRSEKVLRASSSALPEVIVWNRAQALTKAVAVEREAATAQLRSALLKMSGG
jgi:hypothetical protein